MSSKEILDANPKTASLIHDYYLNRMLDSLTDESLPPEFKEFAKEKGLPFENIVAMLEVNPRQLIDFFDDEEIFINVYTSHGKFFLYDILNDRKTISHEAPTRKEAELEGVKLAIELFEEKLNSLEKTNEES
jgi:hypothetical protein